jgi:flavodoxin
VENDVLPMNSLVVVLSYHHKNTEKIAAVFAQVLDAQIQTPQQVNLEALHEYRLIGFGSGIYDQKHHQVLLDLADKLPQVTNRNAFIFSTSGVSREFANKRSIDDPHSPLREKLQSKGYMIVDEFNCVGFNTNSFLKLVGGLNKGRPNAEDLKQAEEFAQNLKQPIQQK